MYSNEVHVQNCIMWCTVSFCFESLIIIRTKIGKFLLFMHFVLILSNHFVQKSVLKFCIYFITCSNVLDNMNS